MKYRKLSLEELKSLEKDFVTFLASNEITASDWEKLKKNAPLKAEQLIELFSDIVFEKVLSGIKFLEHRTASHLRIFKFEKEKAYMLSLESDEDNKIVLDESIQDILKSVQNASIELKLLSAEKSYSKSENEEKFLLINSGAQILKTADKWEKLSSLKN